MPKVFFLALAVLIFFAVGVGWVMQEPPSYFIEGRPKSKAWQVVKECRRFDGHQDSVHAVAISPNGKLCLSAGYDGIRLWDLATAIEQRKVNTKTRRVLFTHEGKHFFSGHAESGLVQMWETESGKLVREFKGNTYTVYSLALSKDGSYLAAATASVRDDKVVSRVWEVATGKEVAALEADREFAWSVGFFPKNNRVLVIDSKRIIDWNFERNQVKRNLRDGLRPPLGLEGGGHWLRHAAFSPAKTEYAFMAEQQGLSVWDMEKGRVLRAWFGHQGAINGIACSPTKFWGATAAGNYRPALPDLPASLSECTARVWNLENGEEICCMEGHTKEVSCVAFTPDGRHILTGSYDRTLRLWELPKN